MATAHEEYINDEQRAVVPFLSGQKDSAQRLFINK
jgi:hypothetical protein